MCFLGVPLQGAVCRVLDLSTTGHLAGEGSCVHYISKHPGLRGSSELD